MERRPADQLCLAQNPIDPNDSNLMGVRAEVLIRTGNVADGLLNLFSAVANDPRYGTHAASLCKVVLKSPWLRRGLPADVRDKAKLIRQEFG